MKSVCVAPEDEKKKMFLSDRNDPNDQTSLVILIWLFFLISFSQMMKILNFSLVNLFIELMI